MALNAKQALFVCEYLVDRNATQAAIRAGYSPKTAGSQAWDLLQKPEIAEAISKQVQTVAAKLELSHESVLRDIVRIAEKAEDAGELAVALKGRELLGKHLELFTEKVKHEGAATVLVVDPYATPKEPTE